MGRSAIACCLPGGRGGSKAIVPERSTPVETVITQARAGTSPLSVSSTTPGPA